MEHKFMKTLILVFFFFKQKNKGSCIGNIKSIKVLKKKSNRGVQEVYGGT